MIRPLDLQNTILQSIHSAPAVQRAEEGPRLAAQGVQAAFAAEATRRDESVAASTEAMGNRVGAKPEKDRQRHSGGKRQQYVTFEDVVDNASGGPDEPTHLIDFTA